MTNQYPAVCNACGETVAPWHGDVERVGGFYITTHSGRCPTWGDVQEGLDDPDSDRHYHEEHD